MVTTSVRPRPPAAVKRKCHARSGGSPFIRNAAASESDRRTSPPRPRVGPSSDKAGAIAPRRASPLTRRQIDRHRHRLGIAAGRRSAAQSFTVFHPPPARVVRGPVVGSRRPAKFFLEGERAGRSLGRCLRETSRYRAIGRSADRVMESGHRLRDSPIRDRPIADSSQCSSCRNAIMGSMRDARRAGTMHA